MLNRKLVDRELVELFLSRPSESMVAAILQFFGNPTTCGSKTRIKHTEVVGDVWHL